MTKTMANQIATLVNAGLSVEDAVKAVTLLGEAKTATTKAQPKADKATKKAQPKAETDKKVGGITRTRKAQPKAETTKTTTAKAVKTDADHGFEVMAVSQFEIVKTTRTDDPTVTVWRVSLKERVNKADWRDLSAYFGREFDAGYWRGAWTFTFDPKGVLNGDDLTKAQEKAIADARAARAAHKAAKKAAKTA